MKIGILTFHCAHNYGAVLQAFALQNFLILHEFDVKVIDYRPSYIKDAYRATVHIHVTKNPLKILYRFLKELTLLPRRKKRYREFNRFISESLLISDSVNQVEIPDDFEVYIIGSDQVWNPRITHGFDQIFFANFSFEKMGRKYISYAASMETKKLSSEDRNYFRHTLQHFDCISVREKLLVDELQPLTNGIVHHVLDPVFLLSKEKWSNIAVEPRHNKKYVLVYQVRSSPETIKIAQHIARQLNLEIIQLVAHIKFDDFFDSNIHQTASPEEFIGWIKNAECVVTTSFHGVAFSTLFNRNFYTISLADGKNTRVESLMNSIGLEERIIDVNTLPIYSEIDYKLPNRLLADFINRSSTFLLTSIKN